MADGTAGVVWTIPDGPTFVGLANGPRLASALGFAIEAGHGRCLHSASAPPVKVAEHDRPRLPAPVQAKTPAGLGFPSFAAMTRNS